MKISFPSGYSNSSRLDVQFGSFPEPVLFLSAGQILYSNEPGQQLLERETFPKDLLAALAEHPGRAMEIALGPETYRVTVSPFEDGRCWSCVPLPQAQEKKHPFSNAVYRMRECLSNFTAVQWKMKRVLEEHHLMGDFDQDLANQSRLIFQMLRLTRQAELTQDLNDKAFRIWWGAVHLRSNVEHLFQGSKSLLTQMGRRSLIRARSRTPRPLICALR